MKFLAIRLLAAALLIGCTSMTPEFDREAETAAVTQAVHEMLEWCIPEKDLDVLTNRVAHDENYFVYRPGPQEPLIGFAAFQENAQRVFMDPRFKAISVDIRNLRINFSRRGDVAWFSCVVDDIGEWDGQQIGWVNTRWTGTLEKRDGTWTMCLMHFSFIPDES